MRHAVIIVFAVVAAAGCSSSSQTSSPVEPSLNGGSFGSPGADAPRVGTMATIAEVPVSIENAAGRPLTWNFAGQSITMPAGAGFSDIRFSWLQPGGEPLAFGRLYVLDGPYFGPPEALSESTPGFLGRSEPRPSVTGPPWDYLATDYELPPALALAGGVQYWFYTDVSGPFGTSFDQDVYPGGQMYHTGDKKLAFRASTAAGRMFNGQFVPPPPNTTVDANFRLRGIAR